MKSKCDICGRQFDAANIWKNQSEQYCSACGALKILELTYRGLPPEGVEKLVDRNQETETLPLLRKGLTMINKMIVPDTDWSLFGGFTQWFNDAMKREGRIENIRFIKERTFIGRSLSFVVVILYHKKKPFETWKFFIGTVPRKYLEQYG